MSTSLTVASLQNILHVSYHMLILKTQVILFPYHLKLYLYMVISFLHMILISSKQELLLPIFPNGTKIPEELFLITNSKLNTISLGQFSLNHRIPMGCLCCCSFSVFTYTSLDTCCVSYYNIELFLSLSSVMLNLDQH